eukprot:9587007-Ditylum_brightwellii.AAC.1
MEVTKETLTQLGHEGIKKVAENLKCPHPDKEPDNDNPSTIVQTPHSFRVRTQKRFLETLELMRYYTTIGCHLTVSNTVYATVIRSFTQQWVGLKDCKT